nr:Nucleocapsid [Magnaporthe oryzae mymonavirus 1]
MAMTDTTQLALRRALSSGDSVFGTQNRYSQNQFTGSAVGIVESLTIRTWPKKITSEEQLAVLAYITTHGRSQSESPSKWARWTLSYICLCFPEMEAAISRETTREHKFVPLSDEYVKAIMALSRLADEETESLPSGQSGYSRAVQEVPVIEEWPEVPQQVEYFAPDLFACQSVEAVYGYASLLLFLCGKKINDKNKITITQRRPQNLIDTHGIHESAHWFLLGEGQMGDEAHRMVNLSWTKYAKARVAIIKVVATFGAGDSLAQRVVYTVSKLLENAGMQQARSIHNFLQAFPQASTYACIRAALNAYALSIAEVVQVPAYLQPYYKLIYGENTRVFHRASVLPLAACAISYEKNFSPSLQNFTLGDGASSAIAMFDAEATARGHPTLSAYAPTNDQEAE